MLPQSSAGTACVPPTSEGSSLWFWDFSVSRATVNGSNHCYPSGEGRLQVLGLLFCAGSETWNAVLIGGAPTADCSFLGSLHVGFAQLLSKLPS